MKWVFYVIVFVYMAYRAVYGAKLGGDISIEELNYGNDTFFREGTRQAINCRATNKHQRLEWVDAFGKTVMRVPSNRVYTQEHLAPNPYGVRAPALALVFTNLLAKDTGIYKCRSGNVVRHVPLCVIKPSEFIDTPTEVTAALGRSITLTCQAKGDPEPNLAWVRDSEVITEQNDTTKYKVNTKYNSQGFESLLTIISLVPEDSGLYSCISIQKHPLEECGHIQETNITLRVSYGPKFSNENYTQAVYGKNNEIVDLVCSADGYPAPTYRWFKVQTNDTLAEFSKKQIKFSEEENQAVLSVTASPTTFTKTYKCVASNADGDAEKYFEISETVKPVKPDAVTLLDSTDNQIALAVTWEDNLYFPVAGFQVQYLKTKRKPFDWKGAFKTFIEVEEDDYIEFSGIKVIIVDLDEETGYWLRVKPTNNAGDGPWSDSTYVVTSAKSEEPEEVDKEEDEEEDKPEVSSDATFYGIFFAGGIAVVALVCMFAMRMV